MEMKNVYLHQQTCWNRRPSQVRLVKIYARQRHTVQDCSRAATGGAGVVGVGDRPRGPLK
jgi:hypothetical protein